MTKKAKPRLLFCTDTYPPQVNGVSVVTDLSVRGLAERGWECAVIGPRYDRPLGAGQRPVAADRFWTLPSMAMPVYPDIRLSKPAYGAVRDAIRQFRPDVVHSATEFVIGWLGQRVAIRAGIPTTSSYHTDFGRYTAAYGAPWLAGTVNRYIARFHRRSRRTFTPSAPSCEDLRRMGVESAEVWGRGVDIESFRPDRRNDAMRAAFANSASFVFVHVGRLAAEKNVHRILEAFRLASQMLPPGTAHLVIAGAGPEEAALRADAPTNVTFLGVLDRQRLLPMLYASADAFVFSSLTETLGLVVLEAMASGLPVIAAPAGGVQDHLRHGVNGLTYDSDDPAAMARAMVLLAGEYELTRRLSRAARRTAESLSWERELDRLDGSYREICERGAGADSMRSAPEVCSA